MKCLKAVVALSIAHEALAAPTPSITSSIQNALYSVADAVEDAFADTVDVLEHAVSKTNDALDGMRERLDEASSPESIRAFLDGDKAKSALAAYHKLIASASNRVSVDFDLYTTTVALLNKAAVSSSTGRNNGADIPVPEGKRYNNGAQPQAFDTDIVSIVNVTECGLAYNADSNAVVIPVVDAAATFELAGRLLSNNFLYTVDADDAGEWKAGDRTEMIKKKLFGAFPYNRLMVPWEGQWKFSDEAVSESIFYGYGQHRVVRVCSGEATANLPHCVRDNEIYIDEQAPEGAYYAVYLGFMEGIPVRNGFAKQGADAYFNKDTELIGIYREGTMYTPSSEPGNEKVEAKTCNFLQQKFMNCEDADGKEAVYGWENAKLAFRGTLTAVVTAMDHLFAGHLVVANGLSTATMEVDADEPLRRLLTPWMSGTDVINMAAKVSLVNEFGLVHRSMPFTVEGIRAVFDYGRTPAAGIRYEALPERWAGQGIDFDLPYHADGKVYYNAIYDYVLKYVTHYYPECNSEGCNVDVIKKWIDRANIVAPAASLPNIENAEHLAEVFATLMVIVSAAHRHLGTIAAEMEDPCFAPWSWKPYDLCGLPRTFYVQAVTMAATSAEQARILDNYDHIFLDDHGVEMWRDLQHEFNTTVRNFVDNANLNRKRKNLVFDVDFIETAIAI